MHIRGEANRSFCLLSTSWRQVSPKTLPLYPLQVLASAWPGQIPIPYTKSVNKPLTSCGHSSLSLRVGEQEPSGMTHRVRRKYRRLLTPRRWHRINPGQEEPTNDTEILTKSLYLWSFLLGPSGR